MSLENYTAHYFKSLLASVPLSYDTPVANVAQQVVALPSPTQEAPKLVFDKMFRVDGRVISLTALPANVLDAILLTMFGQKLYRNNDSITGAEIKDGLEQSGYRLERIDRLTDKLTAEGLVIKIGLGKASRYRLTNQGMQRAQTAGEKVLETIP